MGAEVGTAVGAEVGTAVGAEVGAAVGAEVGAAVGAEVGTAVGAEVGAVGAAVGSAVGSAVGADVGADVGAAVLAVHSIAVPLAWAFFKPATNVTAPGVAAARRDRFWSATTDSTSAVSFLTPSPMVNISPTLMSDTSANFIDVSPLTVAAVDVDLAASAGMAASAVGRAVVIFVFRTESFLFTTRVFFSHV